jgi:hypothetical protein
VIRALLDANVLVSAAIRPGGTPGRIVAAFVSREAFELVLSPAIVAEAEAVLRMPKIRRYLHQPAEAVLWLADLVALAELVPDTGLVTGLCRDPDDEVVLAAAREGRVQVIVTGDEDLLTIRTNAGIAIVSPREFVGLLGR